MNSAGCSCFSTYQIRSIKKCFFNFFSSNFRVTTRHFSLHSQNSEYPRIFQVTGANQNARKLLSTDLVNTKIQYYLFNEGDVINPMRYLTYGLTGFWGRETGVPGENLSVQSTKPTNPTHICRWIWESNPSHIGGRRVLSPLRHLLVSVKNISMWYLLLTKFLNADSEEGRLHCWLSRMKRCSFFLFLFLAFIHDDFLQMILLVPIFFNLHAVMMIAQIMFCRLYRACSKTKKP